jgi:hypothetical protein
LPASTRTTTPRAKTRFDPCPKTQASESPGPASEVGRQDRTRCQNRANCGYAGRVVVGPRISQLCPLNCGYRVELRGLEPLGEIVLSCGNTEPGYARRRESTPSNLRLRERC